MATGQQLLGQMLHAQAGSLHLADHCLCDNPKDGLVVGPYCPNEDCHWEPAASDCVFRSKLTGRCAADLLASMPAGGKCLCEEGVGLRGVGAAPDPGPASPISAETEGATQI